MARRNACRIAHRLHLLTALPTVRTPYCTSDDVSDRTPDRSLLQLIDGFREVSHTVLRAGSVIIPGVDGCPGGSFVG